MCMFISFLTHVLLQTALILSSFYTITGQNANKENGSLRWPVLELVRDCRFLFSLKQKLLMFWCRPAAQHNSVRQSFVFGLLIKCLLSSDGTLVYQIIRESWSGGCHRALLLTLKWQVIACFVSSRRYGEPRPHSKKCDLTDTILSTDKAVA